MFLLVDENNESRYWTRVPRVLIGNWPDSDRLHALMEDGKILRPGRYAVETRINGPSHILRMRVL